jgi:hypothetical protein
MSPTLGNPSTAPLQHWGSPIASVPPHWDSHHLASLAIGIFRKSLKKCWDPIGMKYPGYKASPPGCSDPTDLRLDLLELSSCDTVAALRVRQALHVDSLTLLLFAAFVCRVSWILSAFCPLVLPLFALLCALLLPAMSCWLGLLLLMRQCLLVTPRLLLTWCPAACSLSPCRPRPVLLGVASPRSARLGVLRPKPTWGKA